MLVEKGRHYRSSYQSMEKAGIAQIEVPVSITSFGKFLRGLCESLQTGEIIDHLPNTALLKRSDLCLKLAKQFAFRVS